MLVRPRLVRLASGTLALVLLLGAPSLVRAQEPQPEPTPPPPPANWVASTAYHAAEVTGMNALLPAVGATSGFEERRFGASYVWASTNTLALRTSFLGGQVAIGLSADEFEWRLREPALMLAYGRRIGELRAGRHLAFSLGAAASVGHEWRSRTEWDGAASPKHTAAAVALPLALAWDIRGRAASDTARRSSFRPSLRAWAGPRMNFGSATAFAIRHPFTGEVTEIPAGRDHELAIDWGLRLDGLGPIGLELGAQQVRSSFYREFVNRDGYLAITFGW